MSPISDFYDMMPHQVSFEPLVSSDLYGKPTYGTPFVVEHARVVWEDVKTTDSGGQDIVARGKVYLAGAFGITVGHRITLPDGTKPPIVGVRKYPDENGIHNEVVLFA